ncbi:MAG: copper homeostasis membrane protein CopD [Betaproteobacteria bacterium]|nr:MAG: copper homeostasis membrane protein CopD [Betaproteobacteria bacterium]
MIVAARAIHFASAMLIFGELVFALAVATPALRATGRAISVRDDGVRRRLVRVGLWSLAASIASGALWLGAQAAAMSGLPIEEAIGRDTLGLVLGKTVFGRLWILRFGLAIALGALLVALGRAGADNGKSRIAVGALAVATVYLATLAWAGHAAAGQGLDGFVQVASDAAHLLAAGAWLGALPALVVLLGNARPREVAIRATRRFSALGVASVGALVLTGVVNTWYLVGDVPALLGTEYGRLLLAKLALFVAMVAFAAVNRFVLTPQLAAEDSRPLRSLRRNATLEIAAGVAVVMIVGTLGITIPAVHQSPVWPFAYTLSLEPVYEKVGISTALVFAASVALGGAGMMSRGLRTRRSGLWVSGLVGIFVAAASSAWLLAVPAYPTTYLASPVPYSVDSIARGATLYRDRCSACHGASARGDGPTGTALPINPTDLALHDSQHRAGDLFWWIAHGIPGTPMPAFAPQLRDAQIWELITFLHAQSDAGSIATLVSGAEPPRPIVAPDFTFELTGHAQQSLRQASGTVVTVLVLYTLPRSLPRLSALAPDESRYVAAGARVVAVPRTTGSETAKPYEAISAIAGPNVGTAYAMYARQAGDEDNVGLAHAEFLIDARGYLRARWIGVPSPAADQTEELLSRIKVVKSQPPYAPPPERHGH